jgi:hypothetical protein
MFSFDMEGWMSMLIYHGSDVVVNSPRILQSERLLDFGMGFYTTSNKRQAIRWANRVSIRRVTSRKFISIYDFDIDVAKHSLKIINFITPDLDWLNFICNNRSGKYFGEPYDLVIGPVANDTVYSVVQFYENGVYDADEAIRRLKVSQLYDQILFHTERALLLCQYINFEEVLDSGE